jgi:transcriptional regulator with XRE-family HTH domain
VTKRLAEVAKKAGVSEATVSRVLNGRSGVSEATRASVLTALDVLGYERPTKLRGERGRLVGLVLPELQNPIFPALAEVVTASLAQRGFTPLLAPARSAACPSATTSRCCSTTRSPAWSSPAGSYALAAAEPRPLPGADRPPHAGRHGQRGRRRPGLPAHLDR